MNLDQFPVKWLFNGEAIEKDREKFSFRHDFSALITQIFMNVYIISMSSKIVLYIRRSKKNFEEPLKCVIKNLFTLHLLYSSHS